MKEARARPERLAIGHEPRVQDARRSVPARPDVTQQPLVPFRALLGEELILVVAELVEGVAHAHGDDPVALGAQPVRERGHDAGGVDEGQPRAALLIGGERGPLLPPDGAREPPPDVHLWLSLARRRLGRARRG